MTAPGMVSAAQAEDAGPRFSPEEGLLRLPPAALEVLAAWHTQPRDPQLDDASPTVSILHEIGAITPQGVHPLLEPIARAVARPLVRFELLVGWPSPPCRVAGWFAPGWAVLALPEPDGSSEQVGIVGVHPTRVPGVIATVTGLGPRPAPGVAQPIVLPPAAARALVFGEGGIGSAAVLDAIGMDGPSHTSLQQMADGVVRTWKAQSRWPLGSNTAVRELRVVDSGDAGLWLWLDATVAGRNVTKLGPVTSSVVWRHLTDLLPDADDFHCGAHVGDER